MDLIVYLMDFIVYYLMDLKVYYLINTPETWPHFYYTTVLTENTISVYGHSY